MCVSHLVKKLPLKIVLLKNMCCRSPLLTQKPETLQMILIVSENLTYCKTATIKDKLPNEWRLYQEEDIAEDMYAIQKEEKADGTPSLTY